MFAHIELPFTVRPAFLDKNRQNVDGSSMFEARVNRQRSMEYRKHWNELVSYYGSRCYYCRKEIATCIDHVVPYSWDGDNYIDNLVPACTLCNSLASNKMFDDVEQKRQYILNQRSKRANQRAICVNCLLPYTYRSHSPSLFLCAECYDEEYKTEYSGTREWGRWIGQLKMAGIPAAAHRIVKTRLIRVRHKTMDVKLEMLIDEYSKIIDTDDEFAELIMRP